MSPTTITTAERRHHTTLDPHRRASWLVDVVLGGQDGIVNVLGVLLGVAAATKSTRVVLAAGLAAAIAESVSMAAVAYTSSRARGALYAGERARELRHIEAVPNVERAEIREIYARKGFSGDLLDRIVETVTANKEVWIEIMMAEEHALAPVDVRASLRAALVVGGASLVGSVLPLIPFALMRLSVATPAAIVLTALALFAVGAYKARVTVGHPVKSGLELAVIGLVSALFGYGVGTLFAV